MNQMNIKYKISRYRIGVISATTILLSFIIFSCIYLDSVEYEPTVKAGEVATFNLKVRIVPEESSSDDRLVVACLVPKVWNAAKEAKVTYVSSLYANSVRNMSLIPEGNLPKSGGGLTWEARLRDWFGFGDNVLDDMEWVVFWSDDIESVTVRENVVVDVKVEIRTSPENLRAKLGFFVNHANDGMGDPSNGQHRWEVRYTDCFEVTDGEGIMMDFCEAHFNMFQPSNVTKDDIVTIKFQGAIEPNVLDNASEVYLCATAYTNTGNKYEVSDRSARSKMEKEGYDGKTYSKTFWLGNYFNIPENESITRIEYFFSNKDGSLWVKEMADDGTETLFVTPCICK